MPIVKVSKAIKEMVVTNIEKNSCYGADKCLIKRLDIF